MSTVFEHSIKVPRLYKTVAKIIQTVREDGASLKQLVYLRKHPNIKALYALALTSLQHGSQLDQLIRRTKILTNEPRLDPWLARVLITELLWGKKHLNNDSKPVQTILSYEKQLKEELRNTTAFEIPENKLKVEKPRYVRVNTLSMSVDEAIESFRQEGWRPLYRSKDYPTFIEAVSNLSGMAFIQDIHIPELLVFPPKTQFYDHPGYTSGSIILQDKASCLPAYLLNPQPGSTVLDMCAAPGMKTSHLAAMLQNEGKVYAVEVDKRRYETLCSIVETTNSYCVETINADVLTLNENQCPDVEYILVDPSCSGSGMVDRQDIDFANEKCAPGRLRNLQSFQVLILRHALLHFSKAKRIVYSTCSIYPEENEQVVDDVLSQIENAYRLIPARTLMDDNWSNYSSMEFNCKDNCLYAKSETDLSNGFFVAVFERNFDVPLPEIKRRPKKSETADDDNKKETDPVLAENCEAEEERVPSSKKNKKKKKETIVMNDFNGEENKNVKLKSDEEIIDDRDKPTKKVKRSKKIADNRENEHAENSEINCGEEIPSKEQKKTSRKRTLDGERVEVAENNDLQEMTEIKIKKKKKKCKKSRSDVKDSDSERVIEVETENSLSKKKANKSKKHEHLLESVKAEVGHGKKQKKIS
ncbi:28S rRNA (cytosine-C(5))-methyltransferase [Athalia rosae]|uniref:28S rRNA (cytosine-C(5))-methyltransferase n=1 Tax=Athalia rosae TaxID=37344 RepID=UPI00203374CA|nr:28S rRNA (cytosine-C(5))-methyltransferase [Athalia rosae]XP_048504775.1 28S rRNA (cytosine-C(5))-methyltransferase [Athalia rosae]XP_048504776.1 28S rRNA (cytosine-C(5))-methyltransferase [Athalia rosae]